MILWVFGLLCVSKSLFLLCRLAEKKVSIGYTYEDSTVVEPDPESDKDGGHSESVSEEDEGIPDIGEKWFDTETCATGT